MTAVPATVYRTGSDNEAYLAQQAQAFHERICKLGDKLYLEFGGTRAERHPFLDRV